MIEAVPKRSPARNQDAIGPWSRPVVKPAANLPNGESPAADLINMDSCRTNALAYSLHKGEKLTGVQAEGRASEGQRLCPHNSGTSKRRHPNCREGRIPSEHMG